MKGIFVIPIRNCNACVEVNFGRPPVNDGSLDRALEESEKFIEGWLENAAAVGKAIPLAHRNLEYIRFERQALASLPTDAENIEYPLTGGDLLRRHKLIVDTLQSLPRVDIDAMATLTVANTTGTASYVPFFEQVAALGTLPCLEYESCQLRTLEQLQEKLQRAEEVRTLLEELKSNEILGRFDEARRAHETYVAGAGTREAAANAMRVVVDGVQGELFDKARRWSGEKVTWSIVADRLAKKASGSPAHDTLVREGKQRPLLYDRLSKAAKRYEGGNQGDLNRLWMSVLDHIYACLGSATL